MKEFVVLVDEQDNELGTMEKIEAHEKAVLHRAFSVLLFNDQNELMLQQRAMDKYHCPGMWTNTCCSHQRTGESTMDAANRRLMEEMGISAHLQHRFHFVYRAPFDNGLTEHELDHVLTGTYNGEPNLNPDEASGWRWMSVPAILTDMQERPDVYTPWFKIILQEYQNRLNS